MRRSRNFIMVGEELYRKSSFWIFMKCVTIEQGRNLL
uniref:Uncharacterized protein n=1 Tax=Arundo donax TaxID=35708 RepID=A0A0A8YZN1_ARUDO